MHTCPFIVPEKKFLCVTWACIAMGGRSGQYWTGLGSYHLCKAGSACWLLHWKIPLYLPSCHQLALLCEGRFRCFLLTPSLDPWLILFYLSLCVHFVPLGLSISAVNSARRLRELPWQLLCASYVRGQKSLAKHSCASMSVNVCLWERVCAHVGLLVAVSLRK